MCVLWVPMTFTACLGYHLCIWRVQLCRQTAALDEWMATRSGDFEDSLSLQRASATYSNKVSNCCHQHRGSVEPQFNRKLIAHLSPEWQFVLQDERFRIEKRTYDNQYAQLYYCRLLKMAPRLKQRIGKQWPGVAGKESHVKSLPG